MINDYEFKNTFQSNTTIDKYTFECSEDYNSLDLPYRYVQNLERKYGIQRPNRRRKTNSQYEKS